MLRNVNRTQHPTRRGATSAIVPVAIAAGLFTAILVAGMLMTHHTTPTCAVISPVDSGEPAVEQPEAPKTPVVPTQVASTEPEPTTSTATQPVVSEAAQVDQRLLVRSHLEAGEFSLAIKAALKVADLKQQAKLLEAIAAAQMKAGDAQAAARTLRFIESDADRQAATQNRVREYASAAGGSGANFDPLKNLIWAETSGPWRDDPNGGEGVGGSMTEYETGVRVDPNGMLGRLTKQELSGRLKALGLTARIADLNKDMAKRSNLRLVSLTRLEKEVRRRLAEGKTVGNTMKYLAGLHKIEYVFVYPESGEIVIAGPAEGWKYDAKGQPISKTDGKPTLQLDDLVTVMRTFSTEGNKFFNCLIVPRQAGLKAARAVNEAQSKRGPLDRRQTRGFVKKLNDAMGLQDVQVNGVPAESRVARVIVEADYRMKLIGIDKLDAGSKIPSYFDLLARHKTKAQPTLNALRWWLTMKYSAVLHSKDRNVFGIQGSSVLCQGLNEKITADGRRIHTGKADAINSLFAQKFTNNYAELAKRDPVFADLQNIFDLSLVAALIRAEGLDRKAGWDNGIFAAGGEYQPATYEPARTVMSVSNYRRYGRSGLVIQVAGGVVANLMKVARDKNLREESPRLGSLHGAAKAPKLPEGRWWWDVKYSTK